MSNAKLTAALLAVVLAASTNADADEDQWACSATASGGRDSSVNVTILLTTSGNVVATYISWSPPMVSEGTPLRPYFGSPGISLLYNRARGSTGQVTSILMSASTLGGPRHALRGKQLSLTIDTAGPWSVDLPLGGVGPDYIIGRRRLIQRSAFLNDEVLIATDANAANARVSLMDSGGQVFAQTHYDLSDTAERDRLFAQAWSDAEHLALHPEQCDLADGELPQDMDLPVPLFP